MAEASSLWKLHVEPAEATQPHKVEQADVLIQQFLRQVENEFGVVISAQYWSPDGTYVDDALRRSLK